MVIQIFLPKRSDPDPGTEIQNPTWPDPNPNPQNCKQTARFTTKIYFRNSKKSFLAFIKINFKMVATFAKHVFNM